MDKYLSASLDNRPDRYTYPQIEETPIDGWGQSLSTEADASPRARHRFGFSGMRRIPKKPQTVTPDEVLESLTRQAGSQEEAGDAQVQTLELIGESEEPHQFIEREELSSFPVGEKRGMGAFAFVLMLLGGMVALWVYTRRTVYDPSFVNNLVQSTGAQRVFANYVQVGVIFSIASVLALWVANSRRRKSRLNILEA